MRRHEGGGASARGGGVPGETEKHLPKVAVQHGRACRVMGDEHAVPNWLHAGDELDGQLDPRTAQPKAEAAGIGQGVLGLLRMRLTQEGDAHVHRGAAEMVPGGVDDAGSTLLAQARANRGQERRAVGRLLNAAQPASKRTSVPQTAAGLPPAGRAPASRAACRAASGQLRHVAGAAMAGAVVGGAVGRPAVPGREAGSLAPQQATPGGRRRARALPAL